MRPSAATSSSFQARATTVAAAAIPAAATSAPMSGTNS